MTTVGMVKPDAEALGAEQVASQIKAALADGRKALWRLAEALHAFDEMRGWNELGYANLAEWMAETDGAITRSTYYRLVGTWRKVVVETRIDPACVRELDHSKVAIVVDEIRRDESKAEKVLADVQSLPASELRAKYPTTAKRKRRATHAAGAGGEEGSEPTTPNVGRSGRRRGVQEREVVARAQAAIEAVLQQWGGKIGKESAGCLNGALDALAKLGTGTAA
ncbi:MAG: hypothetical protein ACYCU0_03180 [Solirubrobacteraceae bacterium]